MNRLVRIMENQLLTLSPQLIFLAIFFHTPLNPAIETAASIMIFLGLIAVVRLVIGLQTQGRVLKSNLAAIVEIGTVAINMAILSEHATIVSPMVLLIMSMICTVIFAYSLVTRSLFMLNVIMLGHGELAKRRVDAILSGPRSMWAARMQIVRDISRRLSRRRRCVAPKVGRSIRRRPVVSQVTRR